MTLTQGWPIRVARAHRRTIAAAILGLLSYPLLPHRWGVPARAVMAWDIGSLLLLGMVAVMFTREGKDETMAANARQQQEGEWVTFWMTLAGVVFSFVALTQELGNVKAMSAANRSWHVALVAGTLLVSWLVTHIVFAMRYAHEYYAASKGTTVDGGLEFPGDDTPDYWDFVYFAIVLGMTFQVSDVQITSRRLRRLATAHGLIGFLFNTVIVALTVNIAAGLLG